MLPQQIYQPLQDGETRLLRIRPHSDYTLESTCMEDIRPYVAVSHHWGTFKDLDSVNINKTEVNLPKHVAKMLDSLHEHHCLDYVWLDMVCINQCDLKEKNEQVALMGQIYGKAEQVYAWLGESDRKVDNIFEVLREFRDYRERNDAPEDMDAAESLSFWRQSFREIYQARIGPLPEPSDLEDERLHDEFNLLQPFLTVPYWGRVWIVQELILAKTITVCYGAHSINFDDIYGLSLDWGSFEQGFETGVLQIAGRPNLKPHSRAWKIIQAICGHRRLRKVLERDNGEELTFLPSANIGEETRRVIRIRLLERGDVAMIDEVVSLYAQNECKCPRDKVYAFRELVPQWKEKLVVNYDKKSDLDVFLDVARLDLLDLQKHGGVHVARWLWSAMKLGDSHKINDWLCKHFPEQCHQS